MTRKMLKITYAGRTWRTTLGTASHLDADHQPDAEALKAYAAEFVAGHIEGPVDVDAIVVVVEDE